MKLKTLVAFVVVSCICGPAFAVPTITAVHDTSVETANNQIGYEITANGEVEYVQISYLNGEQWVVIANVGPTYSTHPGATWDNDIVRDGEGAAWNWMPGESVALLFVPYDGEYSGQSEMFSVTVGNNWGQGGGGGGSLVTSAVFIPDAVAGQIQLDITADASVYGFDVITDGSTYQTGLGFPLGAGAQRAVCSNGITGTHAFSVRCYDENYNEIGLVSIGSFTDSNTAQDGYPNGGGGGGGGGPNEPVLSNVGRDASVEFNNQQLGYTFDANIEVYRVEIAVNVESGGWSPHATVYASDPDWDNDVLRDGEGTPILYSPGANVCVRFTPFAISGPAGTIHEFCATVGSEAPVDTDGDGLPDDWENAHACVDVAMGDASADPDEDGFSNLEEYQAGTDPCDAESFPDPDADTDGDGMPDSYENEHECLDPDADDRFEDADSDGVPNFIEYENGTDPCDSSDFPDVDITLDSDGDGCPDIYDSEPYSEGGDCADADFFDETWLNGFTNWASNPLADFVGLGQADFFITIPLNIPGVSASSIEVHTMPDVSTALGQAVNVFRIILRIFLTVNVAAWSFHHVILVLRQY